MAAGKQIRQYGWIGFLVLVLAICVAGNAQAATTHVTVTGGLSGPLANLNVYAFTSSGSYTGISSTTDSQGIAVFTTDGLTAGAYRFRIDYMGQQLWSEDVNFPETSNIDFTLIERAVDVSFVSAAGSISGARVYLFSETGSYLGSYRTTDAGGQASFILPANHRFKFRGDFSGSQYWSDTISVNEIGTNTALIDAGGGAIALFVGKAGDAPLTGTRVYLFSESGSYLNQNQTVAADGSVSFDVPQGRYKFRADYLGYPFWSDTIDTTQSLQYDFIIPHQDVPVTVTSIYQGQDTPMEAVPVYLFTSSGTYLNIEKTTDAAGQVVFSLPEEEYQVRTDYLGQQFWSEPFVWANVPVEIPAAEAEVTVGWGSAFLEDVPVYVFSSAGTYLGLQDVTATDGTATFILPAGDYRFRADYQGSQYWSGDAALVADQSNPVSISTGGGTFVLTVQKAAGQPLEAVNCYVFSASGSYLGLTAGSSSEGTVSFDLASGSYQCRIDYLGYQFWTPVFSVPDSLDLVFDIPHQPSTIFVNGALGGDVQPRANVPVSLFTLDGTYLSQNPSTDGAGEVIFDLPDKEYKVRADYLGQQFWSDPFRFSDASVTIPDGTAEISTVSIGQAVSDVPVYVFSGTNSYLGLTATTDADGYVDFRLPAGSYRFRADYLGSHYWADALIEADVVNPVVIDSGGGEFILTINDGSVPLEGIPVYVFSPSGSYLGLTDGTDASGQVSFGLPDGSYRFRADYLGYEFWSSDFVVPTDLSGDLTIAHQTIAVTVGVDYPSATTLEDVPVYLFTSSGTYLGVSETTGLDGQVSFLLPEQEYKVRADYMGFQYWSEPFQSQDAAITIPQGTIDVHVMQSGSDVAGAQVYLFNETGSYLNVSQSTGADGTAGFTLPIQSVQFRVDVDGEQHWSEAVRPTANQPNLFTMDLSSEPGEDPLSKGLVGYWNLDEDAGNLAVDMSGSGNDGAVEGAEWDVGKINNGLRFHGLFSGDSFQIPVSESLSFSSDQMTFACWVNFTSLPLDDEWISLAQQYNPDTWESNWQIYAATTGATPGSESGHPLFLINWNSDWLLDDDEIVEPNMTLSPDNWYFIVCTYDGNFLRYYIDGTLLAETPKSSGVIPKIGGYIWVGSSNWGEEIDGVIDEVRIYDRALNGGEIQFLMNYVPVNREVLLSASPNPIVIGESTILSWTSSNVDSVSIDNGIGSAPLEGTITISPAESVTYTITGTADGTTVTNQLTIEVAEFVFLGLSDGGAFADGNFTIQWKDNDPDYNATISLYYDTDNAGADGVLIAEGLLEDNDGDWDAFEWDTSQLPKGQYYIYAVFDDGVNPPVVQYGNLPVTVKHLADEFVETKINTINKTIDNRFGASVDISGDFAIVGAAMEGDVGSAYIFRREGDRWAQQAKLTNAGALPTELTVELQVSDGRHESLMLERQTVVSSEAAVLSFPDSENIYYLTFFKPDGSGDLLITDIQFLLDGNWESYSTDAQWISASNLTFENESGWRWEGPDYAQLRANGNWTFGFQPEQIRITYEVVGDGRERPYLGFFIEDGYCFEDTDPEGVNYAYIVENLEEQEFQHRLPGMTECYVNSGNILSTDGLVGINEYHPAMERIDSFGVAVAIGRDTAVVGAPYGGYGGQPGIVHVFEKIGGRWSLQSKIYGPSGFGDTLSIEEDYLAIGGGGGVTIFKRECIGWIKEAKIESLEDPYDYYFGSSVSIDNDRLIIGNYDKRHWVVGDAGKAYIYMREGSRWNFKAQLMSPNPQEGDYFGESVAIHGDYAAVGAKWFGAGSPSGAAFVYHYDGTEWQPQAELIVDSDDSDVWIVDSIAIDENRVVLGSTDINGMDDYTGTAYVFERSDELWQLKEDDFLSASDGSEGDSFGNSLAMDNERIIVGASTNSDAGVWSSGAAYIYNKAKAEATISSDPPATISGEVTLTWNTAFADSVTIQPDIGSVDTHGNVTVNVVETTSYTITASGPLGVVTDSVTVQVNTPPVFSFVQPDGTSDVADRTYTLQWSDDDPDNSASISLYYDTDSLGGATACKAGGILIAEGINEDLDDEGDTFKWETALIPEGEYYIYAIIDDGVYDPVVQYSSHPVTISHPDMSFEPKVTGGVSFSVGLSADGTLYSWGANSNGQLGDETTIDRDLPTATLGLSNIVDVACGHAHSIALKKDGTVWAWGENSSGQLADGSTEDKSIPQRISSLNGVTEIAAGIGNSFALKTDGTIWAWGANSYGELGTTASESDLPYDQLVPAQVLDIDNVMAISAGGFHTAAVKNDGTVWTWGSNAYGQLGYGWTNDYLTPNQVGELTDVVSVSCGFSHTLALRSDGTVWAWGHNDEGQIGDGTTRNQYNPVLVPGLTRIRQIVAGYHFSAALDLDGSIWVWGFNASGELGDGTTLSSPYPRRIPDLPAAVFLGTGWAHLMAVMENGEVWAWGSNGYSELGYASQEGFSPIPGQTVGPEGTGYLTLYDPGVPWPSVVFAVDKSVIGEGQTATLLWTTDNVETVSISPDIGDVPTNGSIDVSPISTTTYTITVTGSGGSAVDSLKVTVIPKPQISFSANPATIDTGQSSLLSWSVTNAESVSIEPDIGAVGTSGSVSVAPTEKTIYTLSAAGPGGNSVATVTILIRQQGQTRIRYEYDELGRIRRKIYENQ